MRENLRYGKWTIARIPGRPGAPSFEAQHDDGRRTNLGLHLTGESFNKLDEEDNPLPLCPNRPAGTAHPHYYANFLRDDRLLMEKARCVFCGKETPW